MMKITSVKSSFGGSEFVVVVYGERSDEEDRATIEGIFSAALTMHEALKTLGDWPRASKTVDGRLSADAREGLSNVRRFARAALAAIAKEGEGERE